MTTTVAHAERLLADGRADDAVAILEADTRLHPERFEAWYCLGQAYGLGDRHGEAERAFRAAVRLRPDLPEPHYNLAMSLAFQGKLRDSVGHFLSARKINPRSPEIRNNLLQILVTLLQESGAAEPSRGRKLQPLIERPLVSVIVPTQGRPRLLRDALNSVGRQSYPEWEIIVVNDGGEDVSPVLKSLPGGMAQRIHHIDLPAIRGPAAARNVAIKIARGDVLAFLDDDDLYSPSHLECLVSGLRASGAGMAYTAVELVHETILDGTRVEVKRQSFFAGLHHSRPLLLVRNFIPINTWGVRRECFDAVGVFDESLHYLEDWDFLLRLFARFDPHQMKEVTAEYRVTQRTDDSVSKRHSHLQGIKSFYQRHEARELEWVPLARQLYLETLV